MKGIKMKGMIVGGLWLAFLGISSVAAQNNEPGVLHLDGFGMGQVADHQQLDIDTAAMSIELWVKHDGQSDPDAFLVNKGTTAEGYRLQFYGSGDEPQLRFAIRNIDSDSWDIISNGGIPAHRWTHIAAVYTGAQMHFYINGKLDNAVDYGQYFPADNSSSLVLGASDGGAGNFYSGLMDDVRIWAVPRTAFDMFNSPYQQLSGSEKGLRALFTFNNLSNHAGNTADLALQGGAQLNTAMDALPVAPDLFIESVASNSVNIHIEERLGAEALNKANTLRVYRSSNPQKSDRTLVTTLSNNIFTYEDTQLDSDVTYYYEVTGVGADGRESDYSPTRVVRPYSSHGGGSLHLEGDHDLFISDRPSAEGTRFTHVNFGRGITLELWIKHDGTSDADAFLINKGTTADGYRLQFDGAGDGPRVRFAIRNIDSPSWDIISNKEIPAHRWTHLAAVYNKSQIQLYIDGQLDKSEDYSSYVPGESIHPLSIGSYNGNSHYFRGQIDELRIWNLPLSAFQLRVAPYRMVLGDSENLMFYYRFEDIGADDHYSMERFNTHMVLPEGASVQAGGALPAAPDLFARAMTYPNNRLRWQRRDAALTADQDEVHRLYRSTDSQGSDRMLVTELPADITLYADSDELAPDSPYFYEITVVNVDGQESDYSPMKYIHTFTSGFKGTITMDGIDGYAMVPSRGLVNGSAVSFVNFDQTMTIELWVNHDGNSEPDAFLVNNGTTEDGYRLQFQGEGANPKVRFAIRNIDAGSWDIISNAGIPANTWTHIAAVYHGDQMELLINGVQDNTVPFGSYFVGLNSNPLTIGASDDGTARRYSGSMDELRIWADVRTQREISDYHTVELMGDEQGLVMYFRFNETEGSRAYGSATYPVTAQLLGGSGFGTTDQTYLPVASDDANLPDAFRLKSNYPNPFNPQTTIDYDLPQSAQVRLQVFNIMGQHIATLVDKRQQAGRYSIRYDGAGLASGVYLYRLEAGSYVRTQSMTLIK